MNEWLTIAEAAQMYSCKIGVVYAWIRRGRLGAALAKDTGMVVPIGVRLCVNGEELRALVASMGQPRTDGEWLSIPKACEYLGMSRPAIEKRLQKGDLQAYSWTTIPVNQRERGGPLVYIERTALDALAASLYRRRLEELPTHHRDVDLAYAAALLDGEGSISLIPRVYKIARYYRPVVTIVNTYEPVLLWMSDTFGGSVYKRKRRREGYKNCFVWRQQDGLSVQFLRLVSPYLKIKHERASLVIRADEQIAHYSGLGRKRISDAEQQRRDEEYIALRSLNL